MTKKRLARFNSLSTPGKKQDCSNYLVELVFLRRNRGMPLPQSFWQQSKYKYRYRREIMACRKFIKKYGEPFVLYIAIRNPKLDTWTEFGKVEYALQQLDERKTRLQSPKDNSSVEPVFKKTEEDLRDFTVEKTKKASVFSRLKELSGGQEEE
jgi:hypothetical protein